MADAKPPTKVGAGFLLCGDDGHVLLLRRSSTSGNPETWGLPGGNADPTDTDLLQTAYREAAEEVGHLPEGGLRVLETLLTKRGKRLQKHYTVFVALLAHAAGRLSYSPVLNEEHTEWRWFTWQEAMSQPMPGLHPVIEALKAQHPEALAHVAQRWASATAHPLNPPSAAEGQAHAPLQHQQQPPAGEGHA